MTLSTARRVTAGAMIAFMALVIPAAPGFADTVVTEVKSTTAPAPRPEPAGAPQPKVTKDEALAKLKQYFPVPAESATVTMEGNLSSRGTRTTWDFMVTIRQGSGSMGSQIASVDAMTGRILNYGGIGFMGAPIQIGPSGPARPEAEAKDKAWQLVTEMYPDVAPNLKPVDKQEQSPLYAYYGPGSGITDAYSFTWTMEVDGVPYPAGAISVSVDKATLAFTSMMANLPEGMSFPPGPAKLDAKAAMDAWVFGDQPQLAYVPVMTRNSYGPYTPTAFNLAYQFQSAFMPVDAMTGKLVFPPYAAQQRPTGKPEPVPTGDVQPVQPAATPLTDEEAYKMVLDLFGVTDPSSIHSQGNMGSMDADMLGYWVSGPDFSANVSFSRATGMIRYANRSNRAMPMPVQGAPDKATVAPEQEARAKAAAIAVVQKYFAPYREQLRMNPGPEPYWTQDNSMRRFSFSRYVNDVLVSSDNIGVTIDLNTMQWRDINCSWSTGVSFPSTQQVITPAEATIKFYGDKQPRLIYQPVYQPKAPASYEISPPTKAQLVYVLDSQPEATMVNALTGELMGYDGRPLSALADALKKLQGHWAEGALRYLLNRQAIDLDALNPEAPITRVQAAQMLLQRDPQSWGRDMSPMTLPFSDVKKDGPVYSTVLAAYREGWLTQPGAKETQFRPGEPVTRVQFAVWAMRSLGLGDLARSPLSVTPVYSDLKGLSGEEVNAIHFLHYLGIVDAGDRFRPLDSLTQAEGAVITARIYNYLLAKQAQ